MPFNNKKKLLTILSLCIVIGTAQTFAQKDHGHEEEPPKNLKVLAKNTSAEEIHTIMRGYSRALGVRCNYCHAASEGKPPKFDFASDEKPEKAIARKMMKMVEAINSKYIDKMDGDHKFEQVTCVTCHMGKVTPIVSVDSLAKKDRS